MIVRLLSMMLVFCLLVLFTTTGCSQKEAMQIPLLECVPAGWFEMGRSYNDKGDADELPVHRVYLDAYGIGRYPVTNHEFVQVLNWALEKGLLFNKDGNPYDGGEIYAYGKPLADCITTGPGSAINFGIGKFEVLKTKGYNGQEFDMDDHPVQQVTWYGAVAFCNWLSQMHGLPVCYDTETWARINPLPAGYRLPTEAEWERAAAWDGSRQYRYGTSSDEIDFSRANYNEGDYANPLGLEAMPYTSPVGWYNGKNPVKLSIPDIKTVQSKSPAGCYDMSGNTWEWCHDIYRDNFYGKSGFANPTGPEAGDYRVGRGGSWRYSSNECRAADRYYNYPDYRSRYQGFRIAISPPAEK